MSEAAYMPTPVEIRAECERIQAAWSRRERAIRAGRMSVDDREIPGWTVLRVRVGEITAA